MEKSHFLQRFLMGGAFAVITIWGMFNVFVTNSYRLSAVDESGAIGGGVSLCENSGEQASAGNASTEINAGADDSKINAGEASDSEAVESDSALTDEENTNTETVENDKLENEDTSSDETPDSGIDCEGDAEEKPADDTTDECEEDPDEDENIAVKPGCEDGQPNEDTEENPVCEDKKPSTDDKDSAGDTDGEASDITDNPDKDADDADTNNEPDNADDEDSPANEGCEPDGPHENDDPAEEEPGDINLDEEANEQPGEEIPGDTTEQPTGGEQGPTQVTDPSYEAEKPSMDVVTVIAETTNKPATEEKPVAETETEEIVSVVAVTTTQTFDATSETSPMTAQDATAENTNAADDVVLDSLDDPAATEEEPTDIVAEDANEESDSPLPRIATITATAAVAGGAIFLWVREK